MNGVIDLIARFAGSQEHEFNPSGKWPELIFAVNDGMLMRKRAQDRFEL